MADLSSARTHDQAATERRILFFACAAHALTHVYIVIHQILQTEMRDAFGLDVEGFSAYTTICVSLFGWGAIPAGWLGDRLGEKRVLVAFFWLTAAGGAALGLVQGTAGLALGMALLGLGTSIYHPVGNAMIAKGISRPGRAMGTNGLWGSLGTAAGPLVAGLAAVLSWRWAYLALTLPMLAFGLWLAASRITLPPAHQPAAIKKAPRGGLLVLLVLLLLAMTCGGFQFWMITHMLPTFLEERVGAGVLPPQLQKGGLMALIYAIGGVGQYAAGWLVHHRDGRGLYVAVFCIAAPLVYAAGRLEGAALVAAACLMSLFVFAAQPIENVLLSRYAPPAWKGALFGLKFALAFGVGGFGTRLSGAVTARYGVSEIFTAASTFTAAALVLALLAYRMGPACEGQAG
ncbi:MAG: MFS transporter [Planctomycetes bacterium]|nr:MFS transporter [Planctomycetota bacterium]